jgi:glucan phosphorylase
MIRRSMVTLVAKFSTSRMVKEYTQKYYLPKA